MQPSICNALYVCVALIVLPHSSEANAFLDKRTGSTVQARQDILEILENELGSGHGRTDEARVTRLQEELKHTFASLPKNHHGNLQAAGARYALHRLFVQRHAWQLQGVEPGGEGWTNSSAADALGDRVPTKVRMVFEERLGVGGVSLHELAVLASLLESMVHVEVDERLRVALQAFGKSTSDSLDQDTATEVLHSYMASYILGVPVAKLTPEAINKHSQRVQKAYPTWPDTQQFVIEMRDQVAHETAWYNFDLMTSILARVGDEYGRWQSKECTVLKTKLVGMESRTGSGRVRLSDFYNSALSGENWQFSESIDYLRQLGALDESSPSEPSVIIPNYIGSLANCVASSGYYSVCCIDECEELMDHLERQLGAPTARVDDIARALSGLPQSSPAFNGTLPNALLRRLDDIAAYHGGAVPLHGRLFSQWLHHAFPRECPFPHVTGTISPLRAEEYKAKTGSRGTASKEEMQQFATNAASRRQLAEDIEEGLCSNMWTMEEELVDPEAHEAHHAALRARWTLEGSGALRGLFLFLATSSLTLVLVKTALSASKAGQEDSIEGKVPAAASAPHSAGETYSV